MMRDNNESRELHYNLYETCLDLGGEGFNPNSVDSSALDPTGNVDLTDTRVIIVTVGGNYISLVIDNKSPTISSADIDKIKDALKLLDDRFGSLNAEAQAAIAALDHVFITDQITQSYAEVGSDTFFYYVDELTTATTSFAASAVLHDGGHILRSHMDNRYSFYADDPGETFGYLLQVDNYLALGLTESERAHLQRFIDDPSLDDARTSTPPYRP